MNLKKLLMGVFVTVAVSIPAAANRVLAESEVTIVSATCDASPTPRTAYILSDGRHANLINWQSPYFTRSGFSPLVRCQRVSPIVKELIESGKGLYIVEGSKNRQRILCFSDRIGGQCQTQFFTLKPKDKAEQILKNIVNLDIEMVDNPGVTQTSALKSINFARLRFKK
jgi:hypothetical protein